MRKIALALLAFIASNPAGAVQLALCPPSGQASADLACQLGVRAKEYALRNWYPQALNSATEAHLLDYQNLAYIQQIHDLSAALSTFLGTKVLTDAESVFPELNLESAEDALNRSVYYARRRDYAQAALGFASFLTPLNTTDWHSRIVLGDAGISGLTTDQLVNFLTFMQFNVSDLLVAAQYLSQPGALSITCGVFFPAQFGFSSEEMAYLIQAAAAFTDPVCIQEAQRAILIQAFKASAQNGLDFIVDGNFTTVPYVTTPGFTESLDVPAPVLAKRLADKKFLKAFNDSVAVHQGAQNLTDIAADKISLIIGGLNGLFAQLGVLPPQRLTVYEGLTSDALARTNSGLIYVRLAAAYADQAKGLAGRKP